MNSERVFTVKFTPGVTPGHDSETWHVVALDALNAIDAVKKYVEPLCKQLGIPLHVQYAVPLQHSDGTQVWVHLPAEIAAASPAQDDIPFQENAEGDKVVTSTDLLKMFPNGIAAPMGTPAPGPGLVSGGAKPDNVELPK